MKMEILLEPSSNELLRSRVTTRLSSPSDFPIAPVIAPPGTHRRAAILIRPGKAIPLDLLGGVYHLVLQITVHLLLVHLRILRHFILQVLMHQDIEIGTTETEDGRELDVVNGDVVRDHIEVDPRDDREEFEASAGDTVVLGIDPRSVPVADEESEEPAGKDSSSSSGTRDGTVRLVEDIPVNLDGVIRDFYHHMFEVRIDRIVRIETTQRQLEADQLIASGERTRMTERIESLRLENLKVRAMLSIKRDRVDSLRLYMSRTQEEF
nr:hypothetical protein [Tanacetum cinerariifolium]